MGFSVLKSDISFRYHPGFFFLVFLASGVVLSYFSVSTQAWLWIMTVGFLVPMAWALVSNWKRPSSRGLPAYSSEIPWLQYPSLAGWVIALGILLRLLLAFCNKTWLLGDEATTAFLSLQLSQEGIHRFFFTDAQLPPFFFFCLGFLFKWLTPSMLLLRLFPAAFSIAALGLLYAACRQSFPRSFSFLFLCATAFGLLPPYLGSYCAYNAGHFFVESLSLAALAWWMNPKAGTDPGLKAFLFGLCVGLGFWAAIAWPVEAVFLGVAFYYSAGKRLQPKTALAFGGGILVFAVPFIVSAFREGYGVHILADWTFTPSLPAGQVLNEHLANVASLFWHWNAATTAYSPQWGGFLNPLCGSFFLVGLLELVRFRHLPLARWIFACLALSLAPGLLTWGFGFHRIEQSTPFLLGVGVVGIQAVILGMGKGFKPWKALLLVSAFGLSLALDFHHLSKIFDLSWSEASPVPLDGSTDKGGPRNAYSALEEESRRNGPGLIFTEFSAALTDQSLMIATFPFNALRNPQADVRKAHWAAVVLNGHYRPFLDRRFPQGRWYGMGDDPALLYGGLDLVVIPLDPGTGDAISKWAEADRLLQAVTRSIENTRLDAAQGPILRQFLALHDFMKGDPLLETAFTERALFYRRTNDGMRPTYLDLLEYGLPGSYPLPPLLYSEGVLLKKAGEYAQARKVFQKVAGSAFNLTPAEEQIRQLDRMGE